MDYDHYDIHSRPGMGSQDPHPQNRETAATLRYTATARTAALKDALAEVRKESATEKAWWSTPAGVLWWS